MRPVLRILALVATAGAVGGVAGLLVLGRDDQQTVGPNQSMAVATSLEPRVHLFGDPVLARVDLVFDKGRVDPDRIRLDTVFRPYEQVGPERRERSDVGDTVTMRISYPLRCLARACAPGAARREFRLPPVRVIYTLPEERSRGTEVAEWPPLDVASRLGPFDIQEASWRADLDAPEVDYALSPGWLAAGLTSFSVVLVLLAGLLAWRLLGRRPDEDAEAEAVDTRSPLATALGQLLLVSANGDAPQRRRALERLARELDRAEEGALAERARHLAWSRGHPEPSEVERLADDVRAAAGGAL